MIEKMKKLLAATGILALTLFPHLALAQVEEVSTPAPVPESVEVPEPVVEEVPAVQVEVPASTEPAAEIQESDSSQETIDSEVLEATENPQAQEGGDALEEAIEVIDAATLEREAASSTEEVIEAIETATTTPVAELPLEVLEPEKEYTFEINGVAIAAEENPEWSLPLGAPEGEGEQVTEVPDVAIAPHTLTVSGECADPYYVVLIYKEEKDYDSNPSSYIFNRAFPCENGRYSYDVKELPFSLESGTFFLLVAGQGDKGPWKPITALIPIGITVRTVAPEPVVE